MSVFDFFFLPRTESGFSTLALDRICHRRIFHFIKKITKKNNSCLAQCILSCLKYVAFLFVFNVCGIVSAAAMDGKSGSFHDE